MFYLKRYKINSWILAILIATGFNACKKDGNPNNLPSVSPADYAGGIDGFNSSDEVFPSKLIAYWSFDDTKNELQSATAPTSSVNNSFITGGVRGKALSLAAGYLHFATQFQKFKTDSLKSFTISMWVQILNNGSKKTQIFQLARPGMLNGNIDFILETNANPASNTSYLQIHPYFTTVGGGRQDNINNYGAQNLSPQFGATVWTHLLITYNGSTGVFNLWGDGVKIGNYPNRGTGNNLFKSWEPSEIFIGGNYNTTPSPVSGDVSFAAMTGSVDEVRVYNITLGDAFIQALYKLGRAGK